MAEFREIDILEYISEGMKDGSIIFEEVAKFERIYATQGIEGQEVQSILADGTVETDVRIVTLDPKTGQPGWVARNASAPTQWIIEDSVFKKKYEPDPAQPGVYKPKAVMLATKLTESVNFAPPMWGGDRMNVAAGGYVLMDPNNTQDMYGIGEVEFEGSYAPVPGEVYSKLPEMSREELESQAYEITNYWLMLAAIGYHESRAKVPVAK